jgi:hypothetical protein
MKILNLLNYVKLKGYTTNFPKSKKIGFRYSTPALKGVNKSQFFSKSPLGDLGVKKGNLSYTQLKKLGILVGFIAMVVLVNCKKEEQGNEFHTPLANTADGPLARSISTATRLPIFRSPSVLPVLLDLGFNPPSHIRRSRSIPRD